MLCLVSSDQKPSPCKAQLLFAANLKRIRTAQSLTQEKVAEYAHLHVNYVSSVERGERNISICNIERIAVALRVPMAELLALADDVGIDKN